MCFFQHILITKQLNGMIVSDSWNDIYYSSQDAVTIVVHQRQAYLYRTVVFLLSLGNKNTSVMILRLCVVSYVLMSWFCLCLCVLCFDSLPSCVLSVSPVFSPLWFHFITSPAVPSHLFLVSSLAPVYLVSAFPVVFVSLLLLSGVKLCCWFGLCLFCLHFVLLF